MKRTERHHLKENEIAEWVMGLREWFGANRNAATYGALVIGALAIAVSGTVAWRQWSATRGSAMLAEAMAVAEARIVPPAAPASSAQAPSQEPGTYPSERVRQEAALPRFMAVAEAYPSGQAGIIARYRAGAALVALGRSDEAIRRFQEVAERSSGVYRAMARLGVADACLAAGQYDRAIAALQEIVTQHPEDAPLDGVLMELGRVYRLAGKVEDARKAFKRVADEFPQSPYAAQARRELDS
ncbi:MAG: tetratricopeptide repeat protein [Acidobacteriota bacterium]